MVVMVLTNCINGFIQKQVASRSSLKIDSETFFCICVEISK